LSRRRKGGGGIRRWLKTVMVSALVSFGAGTWALHSSLLDGVDLARVLAQLDIDNRLGLWGQQVSAPEGEYAQTSFARCRHFFPNQQPPAVPAGQALRELCFTPFAVLHSGQRKTPVFVAQRLNRQMLNAARRVPRTDRFYEEARLPRSERATLGDYQGSGFDRGHMAPAGDMHDDESMAQSFSLANIVPQDAQHNRGAWATIEADTRQYVMRAQGDVHVITGPVYEGRMETVGEGRIAVPDYLYKVVVDATTGRSWVHWHENSSRARAAPPISYETFVKRTGLDFLALY